MATMTWKEFKELVDTKLSEQGLDGDVSIWYIDVSAPDQSHPTTAVDVYKNEHGAIWIEQ